MASRQTCWSLVLSWWYWFVMVLAHGIVLFYYYYWAPWSMIWGRACLYKAKEIIWLRHAFGLNILRSEILGYCFKSSIYMKVKWKANLWRVISWALQLRKCGGAAGDAAGGAAGDAAGGDTEGVLGLVFCYCGSGYLGDLLVLDDHLMFMDPVWKFMKSGPWKKRSRGL